MRQSRTVPATIQVVFGAAEGCMNFIPEIVAPALSPTVELLPVGASVARVMRVKVGPAPCNNILWLRLRLVPPAPHMNDPTGIVTVSPSMHKAFLAMTSVKDPLLTYTVPRHLPEHSTASKRAAIALNKGFI